MSKQADYTPEEWKAISAAPLMAGLLVSMSEVSGPVGVVKEGLVTARELAGAATSSNELIKSIADAVRGGGRPEMPDLPTDKAEARRVLVEGVRQAMAAVSTKSSVEAEAYAKWLIELAEKTASAAKEGGFLGIGGTPVGEGEKAVLAELRSALGLAAS
jgi:hypothetical protein